LCNVQKPRHSCRGFPIRLAINQSFKEKTLSATRTYFPIVTHRKVALRAGELERPDAVVFFETDIGWLSTVRTRFPVFGEGTAAGGAKVSGQLVEGSTAVRA